MVPRPPARSAGVNPASLAACCVSAPALAGARSSADAAFDRGAPATTVKNMSDWFTSGGSTRMPISRHSPMYCTILSVLARSDVSSAAMKYAG